MRSKNIDDVLVMFTGDAVFLDPSGTSVTSGKVLQTLFQHAFATFDSELTLTPTEYAGVPSYSGHSCIESGTYTENLRVRATGEMLHPRGSYRFTYVYEGNQWLFKRQEWTGDLPAKN